MGATAVKCFVARGTGSTLPAVSTDKKSTNSPTLQEIVVSRLRAIPDGEITATATRAGIGLHQLLRYRRGENADIRLSTLEKLCRALGEPPSKVLEAAKVNARAKATVDPRVVRSVVKQLLVVAAAAEKLERELPPED